MNLEIAFAAIARTAIDATSGDVRLGIVDALAALAEAANLTEWADRIQTVAEVLRAEAEAIRKAEAAQLEFKTLLEATPETNGE